MRSNIQPYLTVRVDPNEMVQYVHDLMTTPRSKAAPDTSVAVAQAQWGGDTALARAAQLRGSALNRAFGDARVSTWTTPQTRDPLPGPPALLAAGRVARLPMHHRQAVCD